MVLTYHVVDYSTKYKDQILRLQTNLWGKNQDLSAAYLEWKYFSNPLVKIPKFYLSMDGEKVVGAMGMFETRWQAGTPPQSFNALCMSDLVTQPDYRKQGIGENLVAKGYQEETYTDYPFIFILSSNKNSVRIPMRLGWRSIGYLHKANWSEHPSLPVRAVRRVLRRLPPGTLHQADPFARLDRNSRHIYERFGRRISLHQCPEPSVMAGLIERIDYDGRVRQIRNEMFFAWRFLNPLSKYRFLFWEDSQLHGYMILQTSVYAPSDSPSIHIVDWEADDLQVQHDLLQAALQYGGFGQVSIWAVSCKKEVKNILHAADFYFEPETPETRLAPCVLLKPVKEDTGSPLMFAGRCVEDVRDWDLRVLYSEGF